MDRHSGNENAGTAQYGKPLCAYVDAKQNRRNVVCPYQKKNPATLARNGVFCITAPSLF